ncbi:MAG: MBL fold metallo-hydrolase [Methanomassiliicoccales archaeon]
MNIKFLGGADVVGRMGIFIRHRDASVLLEYGMRPAKPPQYPMPSPPVDYAFLSHCHLDHSGMVPWLCKRYDTEIVATSSTMSITKVLLEDALKVADAEGYPRPFENNDIKYALKNFTTMEFGETVDVAGFEVEMHSAGHVPGAAMYELRGDEITLFTGDLNTRNTQLVWGAHPVKCDNLIIEATYAGRTHPNRAKTEKRLLEKISEVVNRGGKAILPCFAVGRTQEVMLILRNESYDMWVDGMGKTITRLYLDQPEYLRSEKNLRVAKSRFKEVRTPAGRERAKKGEVIVTTGGMLDGGPVLEYLKDIKDDRKSAVLLTGYQVEGSNGRQLVETGMIDIYGVKEKVKCEIEAFDLSAHSDHDELLEFIRACSPQNVVLCHSENREALASELKKEFNVILPKQGEEFELP